MLYFTVAIFGFLAGAFCMYVALESKRKQLHIERTAIDAEIEETNEARASIIARGEALASEAKRRSIEIEDKIAKARAAVKEQEQAAMERMQERAKALDQMKAQLLSDQKEMEDAIAVARASVKSQEEAATQRVQDRAAAVEEMRAHLKQEKDDLEKRVIAYNDLLSENQHLKRDMMNLTVAIRKRDLDSEKLQAEQNAISVRVNELAARYLKDHVKWIGNSLNANNYASCKQKLVDVLERCRAIGFDISAEEEAGYVNDLRAEYEHEVRAALQREEQARIKAQIREEEQREREIQRELDRIERERAVLAAALEKALAATQDQHSAEIEDLKARLANAESQQRAISQAQLTKAGFLYVISNIGSFGEGVFKVGMTRRLVPMDRVKELGDASVPFPFDVHMMISCDDAPALENAIHRRLLQQQVNKTNPRKEFFHTDIETIAAIVREFHGEIEYAADAEALQYRQSLNMKPEDQEFIEHVFDDAEAESGLPFEEPSISVE